jgi:hypothetical protein
MFFWPRIGSHYQARRHVNSVATLGIACGVPRSLGTLWCVLTQAPVPTTEHVPLLTIKPQPHKRATAVAAAAVEDGGSGSAANTYSGKAIRHEREMRKQAAVANEALAKDRPTTRDGAAAFDPTAAGLSDAAVDEYLQCIHTAFAKGTPCRAVPCRAVPHVVSQGRLHWCRAARSE